MVNNEPRQLFAAFTQVLPKTYDNQKTTGRCEAEHKKAAKAARRKKTIAHLPGRTRTALGKEGAKAARKERARSK
jgi:hypothetical protein